MAQDYFTPEPINISSGVLVIPSFQQRQLADRKFFSTNLNGQTFVDLDQDIMNNKRPNIIVLAKILGIKVLHKKSKPELAEIVQKSILFS